MGRVHAKNSRVLVNSAHLSGDVNRWRFEHRRALSSVVNLLSNGDQFMPGLLAGGVGVDGNFNSGAGNINSVIDAAHAAEGGLLTTFLPEGLTVGKMALIANGNVSARESPIAVADAVRVTMEGTPDDGVDIGFLLHGLTAETADGQASSVDNAASSAGGGVGVIHVTAYSGLTSIALKVQHSTDNSAWSDLISFTSVTATTSERKTVTGTVNRYLRAWWDVTGTGSCTFAMAFARR